MHPAGMNWTWEALQQTPLYVQRYCWDLLQIKRKAEKEALERAKREAKRGGGGARAS